MSNKVIAIITDWDSSIGSGHIQRMTSLLWYFINKKVINAYLFIDHLPTFFPAELTIHTKTEFYPRPDIIIRDMRDSTIEDIDSLRETSKVLVIDDNGEGRRIADHSIDILPNPENAGPSENKAGDTLFIYGYGFIDSLGRLIEKSCSSDEAPENCSDKIIDKRIDFSIYPGLHSTDEYADYLITLLPSDSNYAILKGDKSYLQIDGERHTIDRWSYAETLLSSKVLISHFGILLYEAYISKCRLICINPTAYHSRLTDMAKIYLGIENLGEYKHLNRERAQRIIGESLTDTASKSINANKVYHKMIDNLERFYNYLISII